jgi:hypothetical protein
MVKKGNSLIFLFGTILLFSITMILLQNIPQEKIRITGHATTGTTASNVTISKYLSIAMSPELESGILFGTVDTLPATDQNATNNYDGGSDGSTMSLNVSEDSNTAVDFCIKADADLHDPEGDNTLGVGNQSYANSTSTDADNPSLSDEVSLTTEYAFAGNINEGEDIYYRFWLDIPAGTPAGTYNNTITFKGVEANSGSGC